MVCILVAIGVAESGAMRFRSVWDRPDPLRGGLAAAGARGGVITLADGRSFRPAGVRPRGGVRQDQLDAALRAMLDQGVVIDRDLGDGRAFLRAEAKFYNWCGTCGRKRYMFSYWAGTYFQCPVSELLIHLGYADPDLGQEGLTARERWRLEGVREAAPLGYEGPLHISEELGAFRYDASAAQLGEGFEELLALVWKPPPE